MPLESIELVEKTSGATAKILPGLGFNCYSFVASPAGEPIEVLWSHPEFTQGTVKPSKCGIPLLFPFAGRIRGTSFRYKEKDYPLEVGDQLGNAIHGFVISRPWRVIERSESHAVGQFQASIDDSALLASWPADFRITVSYKLVGHALESVITVENPGERPLPFGLGTHGYFRVPIGAGGDAANCKLVVPIQTNWELIDLRPTGRVTPTDLAADLQKGMTIGQTKLDNVFSGVIFNDGLCQCRVEDPASRRQIVLAFSDLFPHCVVFNPPHREAVCIEPYTTVPDPFSLLEMGVDPNLRVLPPGASWQAEIRLELK